MSKTTENKTTTQPVLKGGITGGVVSVVTSALLLLVAFGVDVSPDQIGAIVAVIVAVGALLPVVIAYYVRTFVTPNRKVAAVVEQTPAGPVLIAGPASPVNDGALVRLEDAADKVDHLRDHLVPYADPDTDVVREPDLLTDGVDDEVDHPS